MRLVAKERVGFYPTDMTVATAVAKLIAPLKKGGRLLDPCCGTGEPAALVAKAVGAETFGVEISWKRFADARKNLEHVFNGTWSDVSLTDDSLNVLFLNPPYDDDVHGNYKRLEYEFLKTSTSKLGRGGVLVYIVPLKMLRNNNVILHLSNHYEGWKVYSYTGSEYGQIVLIANRRKLSLRLEKVEDCGEYLAIADMIPLSLEEGILEPEFKAEIESSSRRFFFYERIVSRSNQVNSTIEHGVRQTQAWKDLMEKKDLMGRMKHPLMPLKVGHIAMILASGALGLLELKDEETGKAILVKGRAVKYTEKVDEYVDEDTDEVLSEKYLDKWETTVVTISDKTIEIIKKVDELSAFMLKYGQQIGEYISKKFSPVYSFQPDESLWTKVSSLALKKKKLPGAKESGLLPAQKHTAIAVWEGLKRYGSVNLQGEMGTGKTVCSIASSYLLGVDRTHPGLVICDPTMREKWKREIEEAVPGAKALELICIGRLPAGKADVWGVKTKFERQVNDVEEFFEACKSGKLGEHPYAIVSHSTMSMSASWHKIGILRTRLDAGMEHDAQARVRCPVCGQVVKIEKEEEVVRFLDIEDMPRMKCTNLVTGWTLDEKGRVARGEDGNRIWGLRECGTPLYGMDSKTEERRESVANYIHSHYKGRFLLLIADECHKFKAQSTDRATSFQLLRESSKYIITMTGTYFGGKSTSIFWLLHRTNAYLREEYSFTDAPRWAAAYGVQMTIKSKKNGKTDHYGRTGNARWVTTVVEKPGVGPGIVSHLLHNTVFLTLADIGLPLPPYNESAMLIDASGPQMRQYDTMDRTLFDVAKKTKNWSSWLQWCLARLDSAFKDEIVQMKNRQGEDEIVMDLPRIFEYEETMPKEEWLVKYIKEQKALNRKTLVYVRLTGERNMLGRLEDVFSRNGIRSATLEANVSTVKREAWIEKRAPGIDALLVNPKLVETGLDLIMFQNVIFFQIEYSLYTLWQAVRRVWRLGQSQPVDAWFVAYKNSMEHRALGVMGGKMKAAQMVYGEEVGGAIVETDEGDLLFQLTREAISKAAIADVNALFTNKGATKSYSPAGDLTHASAPLLTQEPPVKEKDSDKAPMTWDEWRENYMADMEAKGRTKVNKVKTEQVKLF